MADPVHVKGSVWRREFDGERPLDVGSIQVDPQEPEGFIDDIDPGDQTLIDWAWEAQRNDSPPILADYSNPEYVELVAAGLRKTGRLDAEKSWVDEFGQLWFEDAVGNHVVFERMGVPAAI